MGSAFSQTNRQVLSRQNVNNAVYRFAYRTAQKKCPTCEEPKYGYDLTTDTLVALMIERVQNNLVLTPDRKIMVKTSTPIELYKEFSSELETATNYTWKGKTIYTQKIYLTWASPSIQLVSGVDYLYYYQMVDVNFDANGNEERNVIPIGPPVYLNPTTHTLTAYRPALTTGHYGQRAEITINYTKQ